MLSITESDIITPPPFPVNRHTGVETLPCPKLRLRAVNIRPKHENHFLQLIWCFPSFGLSCSLSINFEMESLLLTFV